MASTLIQPSLWQSLQYGDQDAFVDFLGGHELWHRQVDVLIRSAGAAPYPSLPLGDGPIGDGGDWHLVHQVIHRGEAAGLALSEPPDFTAYDLNERDQFASWTWLHAQEHQRLMVAAGL
jgi:hypothetical protein